jgi:hypothetical protein
MSPAKIFRCRPGITWVKDLDRVVVVDSFAHRSWRLEGQEMELWELLNLGDTFPRAAALLSIVHSQTKAETGQVVERILARWVEEGIAQEGQDG